MGFFWCFFFYLYHEKVNHNLRRSGLGNQHASKVPQLILMWPNFDSHSSNLSPFFKIWTTASIVKAQLHWPSSTGGKKIGYPTLIFYFTWVATAYKSVSSVLTSQLPNPYCHLLCLKVLCRHKQDFSSHCPAGTEKEERLERQISSPLEEKYEPKELQLQA